jgi:hypothetical protein
MCYVLSFEEQKQLYYYFYENFFRMFLLKLKT